MRLRLRDRTVELRPGWPLLMGIVNAGPDSFSDPGERSPEALAERARELVEAGASMIDVGGESGRTDREAVPVEEEMRRVVPVVERLAADGITCRSTPGAPRSPARRWRRARPWSTT